MSIPLSEDTVRQVAKLARLSLTQPEVEHYTHDLSVIFSYVDMLSEVDTSDIPETVQVTGLEDVTRKDEVKESTPEMRQALIDAFPEEEAGLLKVKAVFSV
jgi:aspartyl-tRNA(Asn)/glutamyl-tRNA(Gln) amidotransferase subunit C